MKVSSGKSQRSTMKMVKEGASGAQPSLAGTGVALPESFVFSKSKVRTGPMKCRISTMKGRRSPVIPCRVGGLVTGLHAGFSILGALAFFLADPIS